MNGTPNVPRAQKTWRVLMIVAYTGEETLWAGGSLLTSPDFLITHNPLGECSQHRGRDVVGQIVAEMWDFPEALRAWRKKSAEKESPLNGKRTHKKSRRFVA